LVDRFWLTDFGDRFFSVTIFGHGFMVLGMVIGVVFGMVIWLTDFGDCFF